GRGGRAGAATGLHEAVEQGSDEPWANDLRLTAGEGRDVPAIRAGFLDIGDVLGRQTVSCRLIEALENARARNDRGLLRVGERYLDDFDAELGAVRVLVRRGIDAAGHLFARTHEGRA